jgi:hypothetical protein
MNKGLYNILNFNLDYEFLDNIEKVKQQNYYEEIVGSYKNQNLPNFKKKQDTIINPSYFPEIKYKNKSFFGVQKPIQTEEDEIGVNEAFLNSYYGYTDYGNFKVQNVSLKDKLIKKTPISNIYELEFSS